MKKELVWNIIVFGKYNKNTYFLRKSLLIKNGLGRNYQPFTEPKFPWLKGSVMLKECSDTVQMWTRSAQKEFMPVTRIANIYSCWCKDGYKGDGSLCEGEYLVCFLQLEYKVMFSPMI